jgi:hypothetical protein
MAKREKQKITPIDFQFGVGQVVPSTQLAFTEDGFDAQVRREEKESLRAFKQLTSTDLDEALRDWDQFPSASEIFIFIVQYFSSANEYRRRDIDNISKTILDVLKGRFYRDDSQVKTLLIGKKRDGKISQDFAYVAIKELKNDKDIDALQISGIQRSVTLFQELRAKGLLK